MWQYALKPSSKLLYQRKPKGFGHESERNIINACNRNRRTLSRFFLADAILQSEIFFADILLLIST